jgi:CheY-like chemotaxis protein
LLDPAREWVVHRHVRVHGAGGGWGCRGGAVDRPLEAGASDYIAKPVNTDQLLSLLRVWLYR